MSPKLIITAEVRGTTASKPQSIRLKNKDTIMPMIIKEAIILIADERTIITTKSLKIIIIQVTLRLVLLSKLFSI